MIVHRFTPEQVALLCKVASSAIWSDGGATARGATKLVKQCSSAPLRLDGSVTPILQMLLDARALHRLALPRRSTPFRLVRYAPGDHYGPHTDIVIDPSGFRCDFSVTVLLQPADAGGVLELERGGRFEPVPLYEPGDCTVYPSTTVHRVTPVQTGVRLVLVAWLESTVRELERRQVLAELDAMAELELEPTPERLQALRQELLRQWA
jgi:PKHD-type hydroxylase